ncbi:MAG: hydrogenase maturation factor [Lachnospiraceae bacterium]|nr:hydrogenase maturation factor [Lachnospiraceae bacterium]
MRFGKVSDSVLKRSVLKNIKKRRNEMVIGAAPGEDCAIFSLSQGAKLSTCTSQAVVCGEEDTARLLQKVMNNLACSGAAPVGVMLNITLPENAREIRIKEIMAGAEKAAAPANVQIMGGHTTVSPYVTKTIVSATGYGQITGKALTTKGIKPGMDIVVSKWIGLEGTALLARGAEAELKKRYPAYMIDEAICFEQCLSILPEAAVAVSSDTRHMHDASEGGIFAALWELAESSGVGLEIELRRLPIRQETVEVCEFLGVNPYELLSGGSLLMACEDGKALVDKLLEAGVNAVVVGRTTDNNDKIIYNGEEKRFMDKPAMDEIHKFM